MKAVRCTPAGIRLTEVGQQATEGVHVTVTHIGICGTDLGFAGSGCSHEVTLGHEIAGLLDDGTPVAIEPLLPCERCGACRGGMYNLCESGLWLGGTVDGGMTEEIFVPERCLVPLADGVSLADACLAEPLAVALHGLRRGGVSGSESVAVIGAGTIGLMAAAGAVALGCNVEVVARYPHQRRIVERLGARSEPRPSGAEVAIAAAPGAACVEAATEAVIFGGRVIVLNEPHEPFVPPLAVLKEATVITSLAYAGESPRDIESAMALLGQNPVLASLITDRFGLSEAERAFAVAGDRGSGAIKVVLETGAA